MLFMDQKLVEKASRRSLVIANIDDGWRMYAHYKRDNIVRLPFSGEYEARIFCSFIVIEGYKGKLVTDKVCDGGSTYLLVKPIECSTFRVFGAFSNTGMFDFFTSKPIIGAHYVEIEEETGMRMMCTGDVEHGNPTSFEELQIACKEVVEAKRVINLQSLGSTFLPRGFAIPKRILVNVNSSTRDKIRLMLEKGLIKPILGGG